MSANFDAFKLSEEWQEILSVLRRERERLVNDGINQDTIQGVQLYRGMVIAIDRFVELPDVLIESKTNKPIKDDGIIKLNNEPPRNNFRA